MGIGTNILLVAGGAVAATVISKMRRGDTISDIIVSIPILGPVLSPGSGVVVEEPPMTDPIIDPVTGEQILDPTVILT